MGARKIVDEQEVIRWMEEGLTYQEMTNRYREKYNIETVPSLWSNFRHRRGLDRRSVRNDELIPWAVKPEHRWKYPVRMLRFIARKQEGHVLSEQHQGQLDSFLAQLGGDNDLGVPLVVHYDPEYSEGFVLVPRSAGDGEYVKKVSRKTTERHSRV